MIIRGLVGGLLLPFVAGAALRPRQGADTSPYRILEIDVEVQVLLQPILVETLVRRPTQFAVFPGLTLTVTDVPTRLDSLVTGSTTTTLVSSQTITTDRPGQTGQTRSSLASSTLPTTTIVFPSATFPPSVSSLPTNFPIPSFTSASGSAGFTFINFTAFFYILIYFLWVLVCIFGSPRYTDCIVLNFYPIGTTELRDFIDIQWIRHYWKLIQQPAQCFVFHNQLHTPFRLRTIQRRELDWQFFGQHIYSEWSVRLWKLHSDFNLPELRI
ncbi:hypothetical protein SLS58_003912 [Diplodia intermedia]|uniref:Uncharacterized protein n=1 Tax=Diplodia intermedia TaxID=856260 RepID=A0ABR3TV35_9PEZI